MVKNMKRDVGLLALAGLLDCNLNGFCLFFLSHRKRVSVNKYLRRVRADPAFENEPQDHRQELGIKILGIIDRWIDLGFLYDQRSKGPRCVL